METLIFYTYEFAASILPFSAAFIFLSHKQKKGGEKTHLLYRPPKVRPKNLTIGGRYFYVQI